jgi:tetratricopeptide (TPR) repeat protein
VLAEARTAASTFGDDGLAARELLVRGFFHRQYAPERVQETIGEAEKALRTFVALDDHVGIAQSRRLLGMYYFDRLHFADAEAEFAQGAMHARLADNRDEESWNVGQAIATMIHGPVPIDECVRRLDELVPGAGATVFIEAISRIARGVFEAMSGRFESGRAHVAEGREMLGDLGVKVRPAGWARHAGRVELLADDPVAAERELRQAYDALVAAHEKGWRASVAFFLGEALYRQGRLEEALQFCAVSQEIAGREDLQAQIGWRFVRGKVLARRGDLEEGERLVQEAVTLAEDTDALTMRGDALSALAEVLVLADRTERAAQWRRRALALYEAKGDFVSAGRARTLLEDLHQAAPRA